MLPVLISFCVSQGVCEVFAGTCACREGYEGAACERSKSDRCSLPTSRWCSCRLQIERTSMKGLRVHCTSDVPSQLETH
ncbi:hypothetical protein EON64_17660, partial [archaeon]